MFKFLFLCIKQAGLWSGLRMYIQLKIMKTGQVSVPGLKQPINLRFNTSDLSTFREIFLREEYAISLPSNIQPRVIIDAGANIGFTTLFFARQYPQAAILSLEPDAENFEYLKKNTAGYPTITPLQMALWDKNGTIEITDKGYGVRGFMVEENNQSQSSTSVPSTTLATLIQEHKITSIDIIKIDIEGSEKEVFSQDTEKWLPITQCLIIELHDRMKSGCSKAVFKVMSQYNFEFSIKGENLVFIKKGI
jgi:FkbM family methyltransferase